MILSSGYRGADIWFSPITYATWGASATGYVYLIKVAELTEAKPLDYFKALIFILPLTWLMSFLVVSTF